MSDATTIQPSSARGKVLKTLFFIVVIAIIAFLFVRMEQRRRDVSQQLETTAKELEEVRKSTQRSGQELAAEVIAKVQRHMIIATDPQPTVATIIDINKLREANKFYEKADNGDHLIITGTRAILYDPDRDIILDVVPVRINQSPAPGTPTASPRPSGSVSPITTAAPTTAPTTSPNP